MRTYVLLLVLQNSSFVTWICFLPVFQKQKLFEFFMVLRSVWKCYFTNIFSYSSLLQFTSVKYASYFQFSFERKLFFFLEDFSCDSFHPWPVFNEWHLRSQLWVVASFLWFFSVLALWTHRILGETVHGFSLVWFQILLSGLLQISTYKWKQDFLRSGSAVFSHLKF